MARDIAWGDVTPATRLAVSLVVGVVAAAFLWEVPDATAVSAALGGWSVAALVHAVWSWSFLWPLDAAQTRGHATREEPTRVVAHAIVLVACLVSLVGVVVVLTGTQGPGRALGIVASLTAVVSSWIAVHTLYTVRYALLWYSEPVGGIDFNQHAPPSYSDFGYLALTVAMSFATSDPNITDSVMRRLVLVHALLSYLFGTFLVAVLINVLAGI